MNSQFYSLSSYFKVPCVKKYNCVEVLYNHYTMVDGEQWTHIYITIILKLIISFICSWWLVEMLILC